MSLRERPARSLKHLKGPNDLHEVVGMNGPGRLRINALQTAMERPGPFTPLDSFQATAETPVGGRTRPQPGEQGLHIQACAPDHERGEPAGPHLIHDGARQSGVPAGAKRLVRIRDVNQVVQDQRLNRRRRLGGPDIEATVDLSRVRAQDLGLERGRESKGRLALPDSRGADQDDQRMRRTVNGRRSGGADEDRTRDLRRDRPAF